MMLLIGSICMYAQVHTYEYYDSNIRNYFKSQKWEQGKKMLDQAVKESGDNTYSNELYGWYYYHYKKYDQSRFYLIKSLREEDSNVHARELLINVEEETKNYSSAICYINEMLEYNPYNQSMWRRKIDIYRRIGNNVEADRLLQRLRQIYPDNPQIKKDISYQTELNYYNYKKMGNVEGQLKSLKDLVRMQPDNSDFHMALTNLYLQMGHTADAADAAGAGAKLTGNVELARKRIGILSEMGRYFEANSYLNEFAKVHRTTALASLKQNLLEEMANASVQYDPYIMYGKLFETKHSDEALTFLINTAMSRGYYDDALAYLNEEKKRKGETESILYKMYVANNRLGNKKIASSLLTRLVEKYPKNTDAMEELSILRLEQASELMLANQYTDAAPYLEYVVTHSTDSTTLSNATTRLYNCFIESKDYDNATQMLERIRPHISKIRYSLMLSNLQMMRGKQADALSILDSAYREAANDNDRYIISSAYEEIAVPYIRALRSRAMIRQAHAQAMKAVEICPNSVEILTQAISTSSQLNSKEQYVALLKKARREYPDDPTFIVKEAGIYTMDKDYKAAIDMLRPYLDIYVGDSTMVNAFTENSELYSLKCLKEKHPYQAMAVVDTALVFNPASRSLLYTKGLVYEDLHEYDSAYVYQMNYVPTLMDFKEFKRHMEEILYKGARNELLFEYQAFRPGRQDVITANAYATYTRKYRNDALIVSLGYAGRDGATVVENTEDYQIPGGIGIQPGIGWNHTVSAKWDFGVSLAWANKYMPRWTAKAFANFNLRNDWTLTGKLSWRLVDAYTKVFELVENEGKQLDTDPEYIYKYVRLDHSRKSMFNAGASILKTINKFNLSTSADVIYLNKKLYFNASVKGQLFPLDGNHTHIFVSAGTGTAPELSLIDKSMPASFTKLNSFVSCGGTYAVNRYLSFGLIGDWYTAYYSTENTSQMFLSESSVAYSTVQLKTSYSNLFFIHGQIFITF